MNVCILMGSPRAGGNTASLVKPFAAELRKHGAEMKVIELYHRQINPCIACRTCQDVSGVLRRRGEGMPLGE